MKFSFLFAGGGANDEGIDLVDLAAPVGKFDFVPGAHDCDVTHMNVAIDDRQAFRADLGLVERGYEGVIVITQGIRHFGVSLPVEFLVRGYVELYGAGGADRYAG